MSISDLFIRPSGFRWRSFSFLEALIIHLILSCTWFCNGTFEPYGAKEMSVNVDYNSYGMYEDAYNASVREPLTSDLDPQCLNVNQMSYLGLRNTCHRSNLLCSQLQSSSFLSLEHHSREAISRSSDIGPIYKKINKELLKNQKPNMISLGASSYSLPMRLDVNPYLLDWGNGYLHSNKLAFLTLTNKQKDNIVLVYKPSSSDQQFYACNYSGSLLDAGEVVSICFVFHPKHLGHSSAQIIIQTSVGGFLIQGKGFAVNNPIKDEIMEMPGIPFSGWWGKSISLLSSFNMTVYALEFKSSLPRIIRSLFKKILCGLSVRKIYAVTFFVVSLMFLGHCFTTPRTMHRITKNYLFMGGSDSTPSVSSVGNSTSLPQSQKVSGSSISHKIYVRRNLKKKSGSSVMDCTDNTKHSVIDGAENAVSQCAKSGIHSGDDIEREKQRESVTLPVKKSAVVLNDNNGDSANIGTIAVKVGKEKRRKRKGKGPRAGVAVSIESPGSQSGYSTPPTPMSPVTTVLLPNQSTRNASFEKHKNLRSPIKTVTSHLCEKSAVMGKCPVANDIGLSVPKKVFANAPRQTPNEPVFHSLINLPAADHPAQILYPHILPPSSIAPHARAPGPKLCKKTGYEASEKVAVVNKEAANDFTYNIWSDYLFGFDRIGRPKEPSVISLGNESDSFSFFAEGPALLGNFHPRYVSPFDPKAAEPLLSKHQGRCVQVVRYRVHVN